MENQALKDIIEYARKRLTRAGEYCGVAESPTMAVLNSDDGKGNDIKIVITYEKEG